MGQFVSIQDPMPSILSKKRDGTVFAQQKVSIRLWVWRSTMTNNKH